MTECYTVLGQLPHCSGGRRASSLYRSAMHKVQPCEQVTSHVAMRPDCHGTNYQSQTIEFFSIIYTETMRLFICRCFDERQTNNSVYLSFKLMDCFEMALCIIKLLSSSESPFINIRSSLKPGLAGPARPRETKPDR